VRRLLARVLLDDGAWSCLPDAGVDAASAGVAVDAKTTP
jgi:hypothetical protein